MSSLPSIEGGLIDEVRADFPDLRIMPGRRFSFRPPRTVVHEEGGAPLLFLHEVGHALCGVYDFKTEVERLKIEVLAWEEARKLAPSYGVSVDEDLIQAELDTYRDFLHQKSRCPRCGLTRFQTPDKVWHCPLCDVIS